MIYNKRYSRWIRPALFILDLIVILVLSYVFLTKNWLDLLFFGSFWVFLFFFFSYSQVYRFSKIINILFLLSKQISVFVLLIFAFYYVTDSKVSFQQIFLFYIAILFLFNLWRTILHHFFRKYRIVTGGEFNRVVILGKNKSTERLKDLFNNEPSYGYKFIGFFTDKNDSDKLGGISESITFIEQNYIDEIYCSIKELTNEQVSKLIYFADNNLKTLKFIPDDKYIFSKKLRFENYDIIPILSLSEIPLKSNINRYAKRLFDVIFSLFVIIFLLSWFTPILAIIIRLESKGPIFFKQLRHGADFNLFACYKFRSMMANKESDTKQASKNDMRVTKVGKFIRRTSIDELPQFFNVLFGSMSVVGPRPMLLSHTNDYKNKINKFMVRHTIKPGITGLAQVSGYRGNIETDMDMQNRIKYDIFYVENWSWALDLKIIIRTVLNVLEGEEKAY
ncbi:undecaprenyl-phosphate glucose phosphotransferase [Winogradskyella vincentii]|uniref:Undecaprenyl-phosphate glucose phosphotransferase n=1 Tax=Winogradskyella vincentii TaxID=2877122 RepID=A0ABS7XXI6_9FLAO|nr:undecaprenyl-phosphate glucose phosphotransferase [Winogradskyella vincentii]MCA0152366.1 undecaprenyl-phosphate glucose phosphotransferase [Winogradskyella vincentii]